MHIGLFFGSFNPIHHGHLIIANYIVETTDLEKIWFVVSPQNPFKQKETLLNEYDRLHLVRLGIGDNLKLSASDIEFKLPRPSYTIDTLTFLKEKYPSHVFSLIMGSDNLLTLHKWKNYELILKHHRLYVYKRRGFTENPYSNHENVVMLDVPLLDISASFIREHIARKISMQYFLPEKVWQYILDNNLFRQKTQQ
ncbi:MAG: nicotinate (nicotinamide) nucleotide adenylyltransferase [Chitinophagales bacterium]|nr:nicotinate (nicotinamide) nucleotide adenylyltransferase [Chitinophagales bacterium]MDW8272784.1 nicotinate (nicotinamide) nucleotide adenylyltransferase [Chitinophagales bacterium]